jgi:hypothetical protein
MNREMLQIQCADRWGDLLRSVGRFAEIGGEVVLKDLSEDKWAAEKPS